MSTAPLPLRNVRQVRYELRDSTSPTKSTMDFPLRAAAGFDVVTSTWVHVLLAVSPTSLATYEDGVRVPDSTYASTRQLFSCGIRHHGRTNGGECRLYTYKSQRRRSLTDRLRL